MMNMNLVNDSLNDINRLREEMNSMAFNLKQVRSTKEKDNAYKHRFV